jgi:flagellar hook-length control protein FliK
VPAPGKRSSSTGRSADIAAGDFAALMLPGALRTDGPHEALSLPGERGLSSEPPVGSERGDGTAGERQPEPTAQDAELPDRPDVVRAVIEQAPTVAAAIGEEMSSITASKEERAAAIGRQVPASREQAEADVTDQPDAGQPEMPVAETAAQPERPIPTPSPEQLPSPADAPAIETGPRDPSQAARPQTVAPTGAEAAAAAPVAAAPAPVAAAGTGLAFDRQHPSEAPNPGAAGGARNPAGQPALPAGAPAEPSDATGPSQLDRASSGDAPIARAVEPRRARAPGEGAGGDERGLPPQRSAASDEPFGSQVRDTGPRAQQQGPGDVQPGRLMQVSGLQGSAAAVAGPYSATGVTTEIAPIITRAPHGAAGLEPGPHPATRQVVLQITRGLDQDRTEIRIRLDPPELGEVDIQLDFRDLRLTASISAERSDTLDLLQRDSRALARALREAGLELADADLSFTHNGRNDRPDAGSYAQRPTGLPRALPAAAPLQDLSLALTGAGGFVSLSDGRMDLRV